MTQGHVVVLALRTVQCGERVCPELTPNAKKSRRMKEIDEEIVISYSYCQFENGLSFTCGGV